MLTKIGLKNFKAFAKLEPIRIAPLTVIMGRNSSGKSSILHSLLLLKQTLDSRNRNLPLCLDGKYLRYSNMREIAHGLPSDEANFGFSFEMENDGVVANVSLNLRSGKGDDTSRPLLSSLRLKTKQVDLDFAQLSGTQLKETFAAHRDDFYTDLLRGLSDQQVNVIFDKFIPDFFEIPRPNSGKNGRFMHSGMRFPVGFLWEQPNPVEDLRRSIVNIRYLSPVRASPQRAYIHYSDDAFDLSEDGSNAAHMLWARRNTKVRWHGKDCNLIQAVNECIKCVGLSQKIDTARTGDIIYQIKVALPGANKKVTIADVGFGYSQIIPIVLTGLLSGKENLTLIEQPEIHLHPSSCANLADLFLGFIRDEKRFIIETHSQDFVNRLRLRVIQDPSLKELINIVFIDNDESGVAFAREFAIDENGSFPSWPDGFIDESEKAATELIKARAARRPLKRVD